VWGRASLVGARQDEYRLRELSAGGAHLVGVDRGEDLQDPPDGGALEVHCLGTRLALRATTVWRQVRRGVVHLGVSFGGADPSALHDLQGLVLSVATRARATTVVVADRERGRRAGRCEALWVRGWEVADAATPLEVFAALLGGGPAAPMVVIVGDLETASAGDLVAAVRDEFPTAVIVGDHALADVATCDEVLDRAEAQLADRMAEIAAARRIPLPREAGGGNAATQGFRTVRSRPARGSRSRRRAT